MTTLIDSKRRLIELALDEGRRRESPRTGLIHFCYQDEEVTDTIPLYENLCFCLALFRSCIGDHVQEGKERLSRLLAYKTFPTYLHEYPAVGNTKRLYFPLYWILKLFSGVIENPLRTRIKEALASLTPFPKPQEVRSSKDAASLCLHLQLEEKALHPLAPYWDPDLGLYTGPLIAERQRGHIPEITLFDLFMAAATDTFSPRILNPHPVHMHAALVFPTAKIVPQPQFNIPSYVSNEQHQGFHLFRLVWKGKEDHLHSFVCQEKRHHFTPFTFTYPEEIPDERNRMELAFYCDYHSDIQLRINGEQSNTFRMGDRVTIETPSKTLALTFRVIEGEGTFMGHLSRGNRPAQVLNKAFEAYDWKIGIRSIERTSKLKLSLLLE